MEAARQEDLQALGQLLQGRLRSHVPQSDALKIGCAISDDSTLVVLSQHPPDVNVDPEATFAALQQALESLHPQVTQPVRLYLRVAGQKQAYAKHYVILQPPELGTPENDDVPNSGHAEELNSVPATPIVASVPANGTTSPVGNPAREGWSAAPATPIAASVPANGTTSQVGNPPKEDWSSLPVTPVAASVPANGTTFELSQLPREVADKSLPQKRFSPPQRSPQLQIPRAIQIIGGGVVCAALLSSIYMLTRPCAIGGCEPLQTAQQLDRAAMDTIKGANSHSDLLVAQQQLGQANNLLQSIPRWSSHYPAADQLSQNLYTHSAMLNQAIAAWKSAAAATKRSQNPPHTTQEWQAIQALLQRAIATLATVPQNSTLFPLAQKKLSEYQANLKSVNQQLQVEQQATKNLSLAQNTALLAKQRQNTARSSPSWQKVKDTWQAAVNTLAAIPATTTAYKEAQQLLKDYRLQLATVSDRSSQEQTAAKAFSEAISLANLAKRDEQQNQFTKAVNHWQQALASAQQIPSGTQYYRQVQSLIDSYSSSLQQAQAQLKVANVLQKARTDLKRTCTGNIRVCNYTVNNKLIVVQMTSGYERALERTYVTAKLQGDSKAQAGIVFHYRTLKQALEAISKNAGIPLQVYQANGSPIHTYRPQ